ncbi:MAG: DUF3606 domain-containing protein [Betaproteobacteria bacterium]
MSNLPELPLPQDPANINVADDCELRYWATQLRVDETTLRNAVTAAGTSVDAVRRHLKYGKA